MRTKAPGHAPELAIGMDHDGVLYLGKIRSESWFGATLCAPGGAGTGHDWALSARRKRQTIVGGWLRGTLTFRRTRTVTAGVSGGSGYSRGVSSRPHQRLPLLQCSRDFRDPPGRYWEHVGSGGGPNRFRIRSEATSL